MEIVYILKVLSLVLITIVKAKKPLQDQNQIKAAIPASDKDVQKEENKKFNSHSLSRQSISLWPNIDEDQDLLLLEQVLQDIEKGRGKSHRYKKLLKFMYPLLMGVLVAKIVLVPLLLKMLTALSAAAVVMSKIALISTGFVALKWIFSDHVYDTKDRLEFIYLPTPSNGRPYRSASGSFSLGDDQTWSDSNDQYAATAVPQQRYIPVNLKNEVPYRSHRGTTNGGWQAASSGVGNAVKDLYFYSQHNYNNNNDGKPFL